VSHPDTAKPTFAPRQRKGLQISADQLVETGVIAPGEPLPLVLSPRVDGVDLVAWAAAQRSWIESRLAEHGGLLFRGFGVDSVARFQELVAATSDGPLPYLERSSPRNPVSGAIYTSTEHPPDQEIYLHNEQSYNLRFPRKIYFFCLRPAEHGGATPIADCRKVLARLDPAVRQRFSSAGYAYVRNFGDGLGLSWQAAFQTAERAAVEAYCRDNAIEIEWKSAGRLRTRQVRPAIARHPGSGELTWFNHATFFNVATLQRELAERLLAEFAPQDLPNNTYFGDGTPIEGAVLAELHAAYREERRRFDWRPGDVLMLDNMLVAHGREPFQGERRVVVGMADPVGWESVLPPGAGGMMRRESDR
jgi:alpha-ketoglutarate-dependent taurine dioxygenase